MWWEQSSARPRAYTSMSVWHEGVIGEDLDLRELQQTGRIGRIKVELHSEGGKSRGTITIPCSLDRTETAILAAALETVDRVGPCSAKITLEKVEDVREEKRKRIIERAVSLLRSWESEVSPDSQEITDAVVKEARAAEITKYGSEGLPAGPAVEESDTVIVVEGRADVLALLRAGIKNVVAVEGTSIPKSIIELSHKKTIIAFLDGDRGGDLILRELEQVADIDYVARAPPGREVEDLTQKEIIKALRNKVPVAQVKEKHKTPSTSAVTSAPSKRRARREKTSETRRTKSTPRKTAPARVVEAPKPIRDAVGKIQQTMKAVIFGKEYEVLKETHVAEVAAELQEMKEAKSIVLDGVITQRLVDIAEELGVDLIVGARIGKIVKKPVKLRIYTFDDLN